MSFLKFSLVLMLMFAFGTPAKTIRVGVPESIPPYSIKSNASGLNIDIIKAAFAVNNFDVEFEFLPNRRLTAKLLGGKVDMVTTGKKEEFDKKYYFTRSEVSTFFNMIILKKSLKHNITKVKDLAQYRIHAWQNASKYLGNEYENVTKKVSVYYESGERISPELILKDRVDIIVSEPNVFNYYYSLNYGKKPKPSELFTYLNLFKPNSYFWVFSKKKIRDAFESGLIAIYKNKKIDEIINKYKKEYDINRNFLLSADCFYGKLQKACDQWQQIKNLPIN